MSQTAPASPADRPANTPHAPATVIRLGGSLGIAACLVGLGSFMLACFGFEAAFALGPLAVVLSAVGMILSIVGGLPRRTGEDDTGVLAGIFVNLFGLLGGALVTALWFDWPIFYTTPGGV